MFFRFEKIVNVRRIQSFGYYAVVKAKSLTAFCDPFTVMSEISCVLNSVIAVDLIYGYGFIFLSVRAIKNAPQT